VRRCEPDIIKYMMQSAGIQSASQANSSLLLHFIIWTETFC